VGIGKWSTSCKPSQVHLNIVFGFTALDRSENAFSLRNQGKGVFFTQIIYQLFMPSIHQATKKFWGSGVLQYATTVAALIFLER